MACRECQNISRNDLFISYKKVVSVPSSSHFIPVCFPLGCYVCEPCGDIFEYPHSLKLHLSSSTHIQNVAFIEEKGLWNDGDFYQEVQNSRNSLFSHHYLHRCLQETMAIHLRLQTPLSNWNVPRPIHLCRRRLLGGV